MKTAEKKKVLVVANNDLGNRRDSVGYYEYHTDTF